MEMERTRKSIDRSREPGAKKPKLIEDTSLDRALNNVIDRERPRVSFGSGLVTNAQRERGRDVEVNDAVQHPQQQKTHLQNQELVSQYKTALAELTFNSKPIITNLTIIAGENLHVAKWIAATICANILEVPSEQKLPSLYLLDSIVKNIGRDYIKYFAARLPEVFCKAYRQVDSLIHPGMRHLFGTWKGVFPATCLQMIEKELAFQPASNGSSSGTIAARSESLSQRPPNSIHVNPKYLEARERSLQQSSRVKGVNANSGVSVPSDDDDDAERPNRKPVVGSARPWTDLPIKEFKHPSREASSESLHEKNSAEYEDNEYSSDLSRKSNVGYVRAGERLAEQDGRDRSWYGADRNATEATTSQRNRLESEREYSKYLASRSGVTSAQFQQKGPTQGVTHSGSRVMNKNWKNSEEEEYTWDDMGSKFPRTTDDAEKTEIEDHHQPPRGDLDIGSRIHGGAISDSLSLAHRGQLSFGQHMPVPSTQPWREAQLGDTRKPIAMTSRISGQPERHPSLLGGLSTNLDPSLPRKGFQTATGFSVGSNNSVESLLNSGSSLGVLGQTRHQPKQAVSPSGQSSMLLQPPSSSSLGQRQESTEDDHIPMRPLSGPKAAYPSLLTNQTYHAQPAKSSFPTDSQNHSQPGKFQNFQPQNHQHMQNSSISTQLSQRQHHNPFSLQSLPELTTQSSGQIPKPLPQVSAIGDLPKIGHSVLNHSSNFLPDAPGQSSTSSVLANLMKSGILSNNSVSDGFMNASFQDSGILPPHTSTRPPLPYGPPPTQLATSSAPNVLDPVTTHSTRTAALPPLPPGRPPASSISGTSQSSSVAKSDSDPFQFLLSSLVANGLISSEKEPITCSALSPQVPIQSQNQSPALSTSSFMPVTSVQSPSAIHATLSGSKLVFQDSVKGSPTCSQGSAIEPMDLIGTVFKADIIRQSHPSVISGLVDDLPHQCNICGIRFKLQEPLDRHLEWHASRKPEFSGSRVSRGWFANLSDLVHGNVKSPSIPTFTSSKGLVERVDRNEPAVPADENQCVCVLCGEPFEDFYSHERDEWMFKGAVYMDIQAGNGELGTANEDSVDGPIVHKNCISPSSIYDLGLINVKQELVNG